MSLWPCPRPAWNHMSASIAAGLRRGSGRRVTSSISRAPRSSASMSMPCTAAGSRPTADSTDVRPPTQSHIGKRASHPPAIAKRSSWLPSCVTATA